MVQRVEVTPKIRPQLEISGLVQDQLIITSVQKRIALSIYYGLNKVTCVLLTLLGYLSDPWYGR